MKIAVAGLGYVGMANAILLSQFNDVSAFDISESRVQRVNAGLSPIEDKECSEFLSRGLPKLSATTDPKEALVGASMIFIATPTSYDPETNAFDTTSIESVMALARRHAPDAAIVIRSTIPVGYVRKMRETEKWKDIVFVPEFLREGRALLDSLYPSRIVVGDRGGLGEKIAGLLVEGAVSEDIPILYTDTDEAESIKLFANTYLAMRVAFFNELDSFAMTHDLQTRQIIDGIGLDPRIGQHYRNPSFGYGGYCLPKDTRQLLANYSDVPQDLIAAIVASNNTRKQTIVEAILRRNPKVVGVHRLVMKSGSDNFRDSSIRDVMSRLEQYDIRIVIYEPILLQDQFEGYPVQNDFERFCAGCDLIIANRMSEDLLPVADRVFTRDIYGND